MNYIDKQGDGGVIRMSTLQHKLMKLTCQQRGEGGVKNPQNPVNVVYERPLTGSVIRILGDVWLLQRINAPKDGRPLVR